MNTGYRHKSVLTKSLNSKKKRQKSTDVNTWYIHCLACYANVHGFVTRKIGTLIRQLRDTRYRRHLGYRSQYSLKSERSNHNTADSKLQAASRTSGTQGIPKAFAEF